MKVSVVIPVYNAQGTIASCLRSLNAQEELPHEVIVIDNNSTDNSPKIVKENVAAFPNLKLVIDSQPKRGPAAARNKGMLIATGDIIAFTDSDCTANRDWIKNIKRIFAEDAGLDAVGGIEVSSPAGASLTGKFLSAFWLAAPKKLSRSIIAAKEDYLRDIYVATFNCAFKRELLLDIGGFDEAFFPTGEDIDLWMRALERNAKIVAWDSSLIVSHQQNLSARGLMRKTFKYGEAYARLSKKHFRHKIIFQIPGLGQYKLNARFATIVVTQHFMKLFLLILITSLSLRVSFMLTLAVILCAVFYFFFNIRISVIRKGYVISLWDNALLLFLFVLRELAEEIGRICGSLRHKVLCL